MQQGGYTITPKSAQAIGEGLEAQIAALVIRFEELESGGSGGDGWVEAFKTAATVREDDVIAADPHLSVPVEVGTYAVQCYVGVTMEGVEGFQCRLNGPAAEAVSLIYLRQSLDHEYRPDFVDAVSLLAASGETMVYVTGTITFTAAGDLEFEWAQLTDEPDMHTSALKGSWLRVKLLA